jgi:hypothetical protein
VARGHEKPNEGSTENFEDLSVRKLKKELSQGQRKRERSRTYEEIIRRRKCRATYATIPKTRRRKRLIQYKQTRQCSCAPLNVMMGIGIGRPGGGYESR